MKNILISIYLCFFSVPIFCQEIHEKDTVYTIVDRLPEFPGGHNGMMEYINKNLVIKDLNMDIINSSEYREMAVISFVVTKTGKLENIKMDRSSNAAQIDSIYIDLVKQMPEWLPGMDKGKKVNVQYMLPIRVRLRFD